MIARLTKRTVDALAPGDVDAFAWDKELKGFGVKVTPKDRRVFVYQYWTRPPLKRARRRATIGTFPTLTVDQAREAANRLAFRVASGEDPAGAARASRLSAKDATVQAVSEEFLTENAGKLKPRTAGEYERLFKTSIRPVLGKKSIADVSLRDVTSLHSANRDTPSLANHILTLLGTLLYWSESRGLPPARHESGQGRGEISGRVSRAVLDSRGSGPVGSRSDESGERWPTDTAGAPKGTEVERDSEAPNERC